MRDDEVLRAIAQLAAGEAAAATEDQVLQALRQLEQLQAKDWRQGVAAETKQKTFQALCDVIVDDRFALQERALAAGALAPLMESEKWSSTFVLSEALIGYMLLRLAEDADDAEQPHLRQAHEKFLMAIAHSVKMTATRNTFVAKGGLAVVLACLRRTPLVEDNAVQARWLTSVLWTVSCDAIHGQALADCDLIPFVQDVLQLKAGVCSWAKANVSGFVQCMSQIPEGAMMLSLAGMPALCNNFIDTHPHSILATRFLTEMLMNTAQQETTLMDIVREDCVPTIWRYLLYHVRYKTAFPHRADVLNKYHAKVAKHRARVKSLVNYTVRSKNGSGVRPLLALSFMFMDRTDKQQLLIDADGLSLLFEELRRNENSALTVLTAFNCLAFGVDQIYAGTSVTPPVVPEALGVSNPGAAPPENASSLRTSPELAPIRRTVVQLGSFAVWRDDTTLHDVTFSFPYEDNKTVTAHKLLLAGRSAVFKAMFTLGMREAQRSAGATGDTAPVTIPIPNMTSATFNHLLDFVYGVHTEPQPSATTVATAAVAAAVGSSDPSSKQAQAPSVPSQRPMLANSSALDSAVAWLQRSGLSVEDLSALMAASGQYEILDLEDACAIVLGEKLRPANVLTMLQEALLHRSPVLIFRCFEFLLDNLWSLFKHRNAAAAAAKPGSAPQPSDAAATAITTSPAQPSELKDKETADDEDEAAEQKDTTSKMATPTQPERPSLAPVTRSLSPLVKSILLDADCQRWLRGFVERGMMGIPQVEFEAITSVGGVQQGVAAAAGKGGKNCCLQ